ncbi:MAG: hypothetical protein M1457_02550, partial [bacterium]|nr:hypothetical protein [bacterium]
NLEVDVNGDGVPEATGVVASGGTTTINVPFTTSGAKTVRVRGKDSLNLYGDYVSVDVRLNLPPSVAIESPAEDAKFAFTGSPTLVPFTITATDDFSAQITVSFDLDGDSVPDQIDVVDNGQPAFIQLSVLVPGTVHVTATPTDGDDVSGAPVTRTIRLDAPPQVTINGPSANSVFTFAGSPTFVTFAVTVTDDFSSLLTVNIDRDNDSIPDVVFPVVNGVQTDIPVPFDAAGNYTVRIDATDENLLPGTAVTRNIIVNDIPQTEILDIQPGTYNPATRTWTIEAGISLVQVTFRATNEVRQNHMPLWLKWRFTNSEDFTTSPSTPPAPGTIHQVQFGVPHTYASEGDYVLSFGAQET